MKTAIFVLENKNKNNSRKTVTLFFQYTKLNETIRSKLWHDTIVQLFRLVKFLYLD